MVHSQVQQVGGGVKVGVCVNPALLHSRESVEAAVLDCVHVHQSSKYPGNPA